jgi:hypothetical protein
MTEIDHVHENDLFCADLLEANFYMYCKLHNSNPKSIMPPMLTSAT